MRLVWSTVETETTGANRCTACGSRCHGVMCGHCRHEGNGRVGSDSPRRLFRIGPLIGPRMRLPQAKDVPEHLILAALHARPGTWHTHWPGYGDACRCVEGLASLACRVCHPELAAFPTKVLHAKLCSMKRRELIEGGGSWDSRGDWHVIGPCR